MTSSHWHPPSSMNQQKSRPPKNKRPAAKDIERAASNGQDERAAPAAAERTEPDGVNPASSEPAPTHSQPITNQDEQDKITNAVSDDTPSV